METLPTVDPAALAAITLAVVAVVKILTSLFERDYKAAITVLVAGVVGALIGPFAGPNITWLAGMLIGFSAAGVITTATRFGGNK